MTRAYNYQIFAVNKRILKLLWSCLQERLVLYV